MTPHPVEELPREYRVGEPLDGALAVIVHDEKRFVAFLLEDLATLENGQLLARYGKAVRYSLEHVEDKERS